MVCSRSQANAAFSFGLFSELLLLFLFIILVLHLFTHGKLTRNLLGNVATFSAPIFFILGIIALASLASDCVDEATAERNKIQSRVDYAFSRGILALLVGAFLTTTVLVSKFVGKKNVMFKGEAGNKPEPPAATTTAPAPGNATADTMPAGQGHTAVPMMT